MQSMHYPADESQTPIWNPAANLAKPHRDRPHHCTPAFAYPDEGAIAYCQEDQTLCQPGRPCLCCYVDQVELSDRG